MFSKLYAEVGADSVSAVVITVALMLFGGFLTTRITKLLKLPNVTAYILTGILLGPYCLNAVSATVIEGMEFVSDLALAFIAFSAGEFFKLSTLKRNGKKVVVITLFESLTASVVVFVLTFFILDLGTAFSVILSALASATAPASTLMTIRQTGARGDFVDTLLSAVALDDVVSLLAYSVAVSVALGSLCGSFSASTVLLPILYNVLLVGLGVALGFVLKFLMTKRSADNRLIVSVAFLFVVCGIGAALGTSPLLACMAMGMVYINASDDDKLFKQLNYFSPPILLLFFVKSGVGFDLSTLVGNGSLGNLPLLLVGVLYFAVRMLGKYGGAFLGCSLTHKDKKIRNFLGLALFPQAGVAIGLGALGARILANGGQPDAGNMLLTIVLSSSILYELIGPVCAKASLFLSASYGKNAPPLLPQNASPDVTAKRNEAEKMKKRLNEIESEIARKEYSRSEEEFAFNEVADEEIDENFGISDYMRRKFINRR